MIWFFLGDRETREAAETPLKRPQPQRDVHNQVQVPLSDKEKWQRSKQRWNAGIQPTGEAFTARYDYFAEQLRIRSPEAVVKENFSNHETRKFLNGYVEKKRFKAIHDQQTAEKNRYRALLESDAYRQIQASSSPLALKLTMMYFGLPVAPMAFTDPLELAGENAFGNLLFTTGLNEDEDDFDDEELSFVPEEMRPLRFLNYYDKRGHGTDNTHMNPEKTYELFYGIPMVVPTKDLMDRMRLRGAGVDDAWNNGITPENDANDGNDVGPIMATRSVSEATKATRISPHLKLRPQNGAANIDEQVYLWGLSGRTVFSYFDAKSFFSAIDRILSLNMRSDDTTSVGITISLLSHPRGERGPCTVLATDQCFLGRCEENELNFYKTWLDTVQYFDDQVDDGNALEICVAQISQDVHFSEMQERLVYRPSLEDDKVVSISLSDNKSGALSYLSMSHVVNHETAAGQYREWFKSLWRMLSCPSDEQLGTYSIGSHQVLAPESCLISITWTDASEEDEDHWFPSDVGPTSEAWACFIDAYHVKGCREFILKAIPITDPRASVINVPVEATFVAPCADDSAQGMGLRDRQFYWGCHNHTNDAIAFQETDRPKLHRATSRPQSLNPLGRPVSGVQLDDFAKGKAFREWSYANPLSIHMQGQHPSIPINAPPLETILKTPGMNGRPSDSVPVMSTQVLTPTEQRRLQETVFEMRSLALNRAQPCPFRPCRKHFAIDDAGRQQFRDHIQSTHIDKKCPLCDDKMFGYYDEQAKQQHFYEKHVYYFSHKNDLHLNTVFEVPSKGLTHEREKKWNFCARCGRDHNKLNVNGDRMQHDNICFPGVTEEEAQSQYCVDCGGKTSGAGKHKCTLDPTADPSTKPVHCKQCALPTHKLARSYAEKHLARCRGSRSDTAHWCPWCGQNLIIFSRTQSYQHLDECSHKPWTGEGPINTTTGEASESPKDGREARYWKKQSHFTRNETRNIIQVPNECRVKGCTKKNLQELNADALLDHYSTDTHANATDRLRYCPICNIDFVQREWAEKQQKVEHFKDHIEERETRIKTDLEISKVPNKLDELILAKINLRNEDEFGTKKKNQGKQHEAEGLKREELEKFLRDQTKAKQELKKNADLQSEKLDLLDTKFSKFMDTFADVYAQDRTVKRRRDSASTANNSEASLSKKQRTATIPGPINPLTPQQPSPGQNSWVTTPSTGSSGAIMTSSDDTGPLGYRGPEPSSASSRTLGPSGSPQVQNPARSSTRTQGRNTTVAPRTSEQQVVGSTLESVPINLAPKPSGPRQVEGSATRTRARRAQIARSRKDEKEVAHEGDNDEEEGDEQ